MMDFFRGWRRKMGCLTLVLACMATAGWIRSFREVNSIAFHIGGRCLVQLISRERTAAVRVVRSTLPVNELRVDRVLLLGFQPPAGNSTGHLAVNVDAPTRTAEGSPFHWIANGWDFEIGGVTDQKLPLRVFIVRAPYWVIVLPLTLLSIWLMLAKKSVEPPKDQP